MSRIGKKPIIIPDGVLVSASDNIVSISGPKGTLERVIPRGVRVEVVGKEIFVKPGLRTKKTAALWGLTRALLANMVEGVTKGFEKKLEFEGIGYRVNLEGNVLLMQLGFSHPVKLPAPDGVRFSVEKNVINVSGINKELVGQIASRVRSLKPPEPYKGKGIRYQGEVILRKAGKKAVASS